MAHQAAKDEIMKGDQKVLYQVKKELKSLRRRQVNHKKIVSHPPLIRPFLVPLDPQYPFYPQSNKRTNKRNKVNHTGHVMTSLTSGRP